MCREGFARQQNEWRLADVVADAKVVVSNIEHFQKEV